MSEECNTLHTALTFARYRVNLAAIGDEDQASPAMADAALSSGSASAISTQKVGSMLVRPDGLSLTGDVSEALRHDRDLR